jgi:hypothetical protein
MNWSDRIKRGQEFTRVAGNQAIKNAGGSWFAVSHNNVPHSRGDGIKCAGDWFGPNDWVSHGSSGSRKRKFASALIAKIPESLSRHIARTYFPPAKGTAK